MSGVIDLKKFRQSRAEIPSAHGLMIADPGFQFKVGRYVAPNGMTYAALSVVDPQVNRGEPRNYLITREGALQAAQMLGQIAGEVN